MPLNGVRKLILAAATGALMTASSVGTAAKPIPIMDLHSDILLRVMENGVDIGAPPPWAQVTIPSMREGHVTDQVFAVWMDPDDWHGLEATNHALQIIDKFHQQQEKYSDDIELALTEKDAERIRKNGKIAVYLWIEGGVPINDDLALLRTFHRLGVRGMTLTWTSNLSWAGSSGDKQNMGLTDFGREVVREMDRLNMIVDLSHVSDQTFFDALEVTRNPVVISHSSCRALCRHPRNVTDEMLQALAKNGGVIGINALPEFLSDDFETGWQQVEASHKAELDALKKKYNNKTGNPEYREERRQLFVQQMDKKYVVTLDTYLDHIEHAMKVAGPEHVALGADFDGIWTFPVGLEKASKWQRVVEGLRKRGHSEKIIRGIMGDNARRVFKQVLDRKE
ncbi:dipeptidase [Candidatus Sumerlaeota bacterium]|nr:dipeptidase [Candidatus Sumerlaeota bacterium]